MYGSLNTAGSYTTVGVLLGGPDAQGRCIIQDVVPGSPAQLVGKLKKGDTILQVDGENVDTKNIVEKIKGSDLPSSSVSIQVTRVGKKRPLEVTILRATKESVEYSRKTFEMLSQLAQLSGASGFEDDSEGPACGLEKGLRIRLAALEHEKLQQEVVLQEKETKSDIFLSSAKALVAEFATIAVSTFGENAPATHLAGASDDAPSSRGALRDAALKMGRATQFLEESCMNLRARIAGKLVGMENRLERVGEMSGRVRESLVEKGAGSNTLGNDLETATKMVKLQESLADSDEELLKSRQRTTGLVSQVEVLERKILQLDSKSQAAGGKHMSNTSSASSAEPGGPVVENNAVDSKRLALELSRLQHDIHRQKEEHVDEMNQRDCSLSELSSSLFAAQERASASMSELVTLRMENLKLKEQAVEKERKMANSVEQSRDEYAQLQAKMASKNQAFVDFESLCMQNLKLKEQENLELKEQAVEKERKMANSVEHSRDEYAQLQAKMASKNQAFVDLEALYMQTQQKYVETSQNLTRRTKDLSTLMREAQISSNDQQTAEDLLRRETEELTHVQRAMATIQRNLQAAEAATQTAQSKLQASEQSRKTLEDKYASGEQLRKNMEETFSRERQDGMVAMRERDALKKQRNALQSELEVFKDARVKEVEGKVNDEQLRWKRNLDAMEYKLKVENERDTATRLERVESERDALLADVKETQLLLVHTQEHAKRNLEVEKRKEEQAARERDGLKVEMDESRYVIGQLTAEVRELRSMQRMASTAPLHLMQSSGTPKTQRAALPTVLQVQTSRLSAGPPQPQRPTEPILPPSPRNREHRDMMPNTNSAHWQPGAAQGSFAPRTPSLPGATTAGNGVPPPMSSLTAGNSTTARLPSGGTGGTSSGVYSNRSGRLFAM